MAYRYLGYGITNDKGIAKLEFDENGDPITHSYTGTGAGELDIIASLDDSSKISDSSIQSETYSLWDTLFHLECTSETNNWNYNDARVSASFDENGGHFTGLESTSFKQVNLTNNGTRFLDGTKNQTIEYDIKKNIALRLALFDNGANSRQILFFGNSYSNDWNHIKLVYNADNHTVTPYVNDNALTPVDLSSYTMTTFGITFLDNTSNQMDFYVKNIKIYYD